MTGDVDPRCAYSLPHYRHILRAAKHRYGWLPRVHEVASGVPERPFLLIRHDVDISPWAALAMAELEHAEDVHTTYYFRLHAPYYNCLDGAVLDAIRAIAALGHEVGLHYEPGFFLERGEDPVAGTRRDIRTFDELVGFRTRTIAQHQPAQGPLLADIDPERPCAYQPALVRGIPYFGDSGFHWREGCVCTKFDRPQVHTLIHPHSWVLWDRPWQDVLRAHARDLSARLAAEMEAYIASVETYLAARPRLDAEREARYGGDHAGGAAGAREADDAGDGASSVGEGRDARAGCVGESGDSRAGCVGEGGDARAGSTDGETGEGDPSREAGGARETGDAEVGERARDGADGSKADRRRREGAGPPRRSGPPAPGRRAPGR